MRMLRPVLLNRLMEAAAGGRLQLPDQAFGALASQPP